MGVENNDDQNKQAPPPMVQEPNIEQMLVELEDLYAEEVTTGDDINPRLADLIVRMIRANLSEEMIKNKLKNCPTPGNLP